MRSLAAAFASGIVFAVGLAVAGMTRPAKVAAFLDFFGDWDPSLAFVMVGAIAVYASAFRGVLRLRSPGASRLVELPTAERIDARLIVGSAVFGVGWGISGFCPGPALASLSVGTSHVAIFVAAMAAGVLMSRALDRARASTRRRFS